MRDEVSAFFLGTTARLTSHDIISTKAAWANRCRLVTLPTGRVICFQFVRKKVNIGHHKFKRDVEEFQGIHGSPWLTGVNLLLRLARPPATDELRPDALPRT